MANSLFEGVKTSADLGANIKEERTALGLTVAHVARAAQVSANTVRRIEAGNANPRLGTVIAIARALGKCRATFGID